MFWREQRGEQVERILETYHFGPHQVEVLEHAGDEGSTYVVLVDGAVITDSPLPVRPRLEDVVRMYARAEGQV